MYPEKNSVVLVDENDRSLASIDKMEAHELGLLHRAFSVFIFNAEGKMLIHQRAKSKYHCGGLWTNACCSHPYLFEEPKDAAKRRLKEELGFSCDVTKAFSFIYKAELDKGLTEHEYDHVFIGNYEGNINPNEDEVENYEYLDCEFLALEVKHFPDKFTPWFRIALPKVLELVKKMGIAA